MKAEAESDIIRYPPGKKSFKGDQTERDIEHRLLEGIASGRSRMPAAKFFERMHVLVDRVAAESPKQGRRAKATRSAKRG
jgi:hypothetical protein